jgi:hypothetical protein
MENISADLKSGPPTVPKPRRPGAQKPGMMARFPSGERPSSGRFATGSECRGASNAPFARFNA